MYNNNYHDESRHERLKVLFLTTILLFSTITNIFSISSFYSNFGFLKEVDALTTKESGSANIEKEVINCNNLNLNVNSRLTDNNNIDGQIFNPSREDKTEINADNNKYSNFKYNSKDNSRTVICKNLNVNEIYNQQEQPIDITETLTVIKNIRCEADTETCQQIQIQPSQFNVVIEGKNPSQNNFPGSSIGTNVELEEGRYSVSEEGLDPVTPELCNTMSFEAGQVASELGENLFICTNFSEECEGNITVGNPQTCTIENVIVEQKIIGNNVYIVWSNDDNGQVNIFFSASTDNGQTFSTPIDVSSDTGFSYFGQMIVQ